MIGSLPCLTRKRTAPSARNHLRRVGFDREDNELNEGFKPEWHHISPLKILKDKYDEFLIDFSSAQMLCCRSQFFGGTGLSYTHRCSAVLIQKVVAMLAEIFMVRSEAKVTVGGRNFPSSTSRFIPFSPRTQFTFKQPDLKGEETPNEEQYVKVVR